MSIMAYIMSLEAGGYLSELHPSFGANTGVQRVFAFPAAEGPLKGPWVSPLEAAQFNRAKAVLDLFMQGETMATRAPPSTSGRAQLALLDPAEDRVWEFRTRKGKLKKNEPRYGVRIFGMFACKDVFIAMLTDSKENCLEDDDYTLTIEACKRHWRSYFSSYDPALGDSTDDYLTNWFSC
jgi:hypothetical protein